MSIKNHPNFNVNGFACAITKALYANLRGSARKEKINDEKFFVLLAAFCEECEQIVDDSVCSE